ncbi:LIM domain protein [Oesophagostomum dentatum]|uniref:LIM domain protein n=1 Tax=Oesophagostomum dentatum TaxID=61180 RepID=A0A0B1SKC5_OESDE|nr:LIM domain protein [Oesophagostomum dentatum]
MRTFYQRNIEIIIRWQTLPAARSVFFYRKDNPTIKKYVSFFCAYNFFSIKQKFFQDSLEKRTKCSKPISDRLLRACGGTFHVNCFTCTNCNKTLDGVPFTADAQNNVHCVPCFHEKFAPRCAVCNKGIIPQEGEKESVRVVAMDKSFHPNCYRCEDCGLLLSSKVCISHKVEGAGCYPLNSRLYCKTFNSHRLRMQATA